MSESTPSVKERRTRILLALLLLNREKSHNLFNPTIKAVFLLSTESPRTRGTLRQMLTDGVIRREEEGVYQITDRGMGELALSFPFVRFMMFSWDGKYRIISYEIPEDKRSLRDSLRREISGWGLGPWHRSFWLTPHPVAEAMKKLVEGTPWENYIQMFEGTPTLGDPSILVEKVWNIQKLQEAYKKVFKTWHELLSREDLSKEAKLAKVVNSYIEVLKTDPGLPKELVGEKWIGKDAFDIFSEMRSILLS
ncbi:MAG: hypothetical protein NUV52_00860 [Candidatus Roizmanbacteria bacterium]|nr:hypothetical protein [Candidatus Roizmanbacteria bacterium]